MRGSYILFLYVKEDTRIRVGALGYVRFKRGLYLYVGSALSSVEKRIERHRRRVKRRRWHIDHLTSSRKVEVVGALIIEGEERMECRLSQIVSRIEGCSVPVAGFGYSDCRECPYHLYYVGE